MCARKYGMCARKYGPLGHQTDDIRNDVISSYEVAGLHITAPMTYAVQKWEETLNGREKISEGMFHHVAK